MRHFTAIQNTLEALEAIKTGMANDIPSDLLSIDLNVALDALGAITGEVNTEDLLGNIFSKFCIGK
jgi:tRNA modification GTPase